LNTLGSHLLVELNGCNEQLLDDLSRVKSALIDAADEAGATIVGEIFHEFSPVGVTGVVAIAESHISIHTWPEHGYAAVDVFSCSETFRPHEAARLIVERLGAESHTVQVIERGTTALLAPAI
jgi:S-adenosylmethionine decarboxylase